MHLKFRSAFMWSLRRVKSFETLLMASIFRNKAGISGILIPLLLYQSYYRNLMQAASFSANQLRP